MPRSCKRRVQASDIDVCLNSLAFALPGKGAALLRLQQFHNASRVIFVGDDETDEEVFQLNRLKSILGIRVGPEKGSAAQYFIDDQLQIDALLALILAA